MTPESQASIDPTTASPARIYDYMLGGKDNFEIDRAIGDRMIAAFPDARAVLWENRRFLIRAVTHLAVERGVRRFLDIGSGLPTQDNVHQVAERHSPGSRIVYADNDPIVLSHARALLSAPNATIVDGDLRAPGDILAAPEVRELLAPGEPVALLLVAILHFIKDGEDPYGNVAALVDALPPGSFVVLSHGTDVVKEATDVATAEYQRHASADLNLRPHEDVLRFFDGLDLLDPGLVWAKDWKPDGSQGDTLGVWAGVARKP